MFKVVQFRAGAPDKAFKFTSGDYELIQRDGVDLKDYSEEELKNISSDEYFLSANEDDILYANSLPLNVQKRVILPSYKDGKVINYYDFVPKDSKFYQGINSNTEFDYNLIKIYTPDEFGNIYDELKNLKTFALKVAIGAGSRGVIVVNPDRIPQAGAREQFRNYTESDVNRIIRIAESHKCNIIIQPLAYTDLDKQNKFDLSFILRQGHLVCYHWSHPDNDSTNWDHGEFIRNKYTEKCVNSLVNYLLKCGVTDGFFNLDGYTDYIHRPTLIEINWRLANCVFIFEAFNIDYIEAYLYPEMKDWNNIIPEGITPYIRYWRCSLFNLQKGGKL